MGEIEEYARLVVQVGVDVQRGQDVIVHAEIDHAPFVRAVVAEAYRAGARAVDVDFRDAYVRGALVAGGSEESFGVTPASNLARIQDAMETGAAVIAIAGGSNAEVYEGLDPARLARARMPEYERAWIEAVNERKVPWTIVAYPTERWARETFGEPDVDRLWKAVSHVMRLHLPDPPAALAPTPRALGGPGRAPSGAWGGGAPPCPSAGSTRSATAVRAPSSRWGSSMATAGSPAAA